MRIVIIGAGPAGVTVAETVRQYDKDAEIVILSGEDFPPYSPPAMLEYFTSGTEVHFWKGRDFARQLSVDVRRGTEVTSLLPEENKVVLSRGGRLEYDKLVIASGGRLYTPLEGADKEGVYNFKSLSAAEELIRTVKKKKGGSALVIGAGFIGVEIALLLSSLGVEVTVLVRSRVMRTTLDPESSEIILGILKDRGVTAVTGDSAFAVSIVGTKRAKAVKMKSGDELRADVLIAATGIKPNIGYLEHSGIETDWGVLVDRNLKTNLPDIFAAGDVAETYDRITGKRYVHANFLNAVEQGRIVGQNLLGWEMEYEGAERMNSLKHLGIPVMSAGEESDEELRYRSDGTLRKIFLQDNCISGFRLVGDISSAGILRSLMNKKSPVDAFKDRLLEPTFGVGTVEESVFI